MTGFTKAVCSGCAYLKCGHCQIAKSQVKYMNKCPENYTHELIKELRDDYNRRIQGLPHSDVLAREW